MKIDLMTALEKMLNKLSVHEVDEPTVQELKKEFAGRPDVRVDEIQRNANNENLFSVTTMNLKGEETITDYVKGADGKFRERGMENLTSAGSPEGNR